MRKIMQTTTLALCAAMLGAASTATADLVIPHAANAAQVAVSRRVTLVKLECIETEDNTAEGDEPYITVNGKKIWSAADSIDNDSELAVNRKVNVGDTVSLWDEDSPDGDDLLGSEVVEGDQGSLVFKNDGAYYVLHYRPG